MVEVAREAERQMRVRRVDIPGSFQRCLDGTAVARAFPAQVDLSGGATSSLTPLLSTGGGQPTGLSPQTWGQLPNVTKGGFLSQEHKSVYKIEKISSVCFLFIYIYSICFKKKLYKH